MRRGLFVSIIRDYVRSRSPSNACLAAARLEPRLVLTVTRSNQLTRHRKAGLGKLDRVKSGYPRLSTNLAPSNRNIMGESRSAVRNGERDARNQFHAARITAGRRQLGVPTVTRSASKPPVSNPS